MMRTVHTSLKLMLVLLIAACTNYETNSEATVDIAGDRPQIILDTDFGGDADDLAALIMLHHYLDTDKIELLGVVSWSSEKYAIPAIAAVNQFYGRPGVKLGLRPSQTWESEWTYSKAIADQFPYDPAIVDGVEPAVRLYRQLLADAEPGSVTLVTIGPLTNIRDLIRSQPDEISQATGSELIAEKVDRMVIMGGQFPSGETVHGPEWNFSGSAKGVTREVLEAIERPIVFSGYEVGAALNFGSALNRHPKDTPLYVGYLHHSAHAPWLAEWYKGEILDTATFDQTAVMFAATGGLGIHWELSEAGTLSVDDNGIGTWTEDEAGTHHYLILSGDAEETVAQIASAMTH
ncbi:MAG: nucleoside hydrolase [Pseudomonadota bacterium]